MNQELNTQTKHQKHAITKSQEHLKRCGSACQILCYSDHQYCDTSLFLQFANVFHKEFFLMDFFYSMLMLYYNQTLFK